MFMRGVSRAVADNRTTRVVDDIVSVARRAFDLPATQLVNGIVLPFKPAANLYQFHRLRFTDCFGAFLLLIGWAVVASNVVGSHGFRVEVAESCVWQCRAAIEIWAV